MFKHGTFQHYSLSLCFTNDVSTWPPETTPEVEFVYLLCLHLTAAPVAEHARSPVIVPVVDCRCYTNRCEM